jgi:hypothetical protein
MEQNNLKHGIGMPSCLQHGAFPRCLDLSQGQPFIQNVNWSQHDDSEAVFLDRILFSMIFKAEDEVTKD